MVPSGAIFLCALSGVHGTEAHSDLMEFFASINFSSASTPAPITVAQESTTDPGVLEGAFFHFIEPLLAR